MSIDEERQTKGVLLCFLWYMAISTFDLASSAATVDGCRTSVASWMTAPTNSNSFAVKFATIPAAVPRNQLFRIVAWVDGRAEVEELRASAEMQAHQHGMTTKPIAQRCSDGSFQIDGMLFHMPGVWTIYFDIRSRGVVERAQMDLVVR